MGVINSIIEQDLTDNEYVKNYTNGFSELSEHAKSKTPEWASKITGIKAEDIKKLAFELATIQPAAIRMGVALERHYGGGRSEEHTSELQSRTNLVCRLLLEKKK